MTWSTKCLCQTFPCSAYVNFSSHWYCHITFLFLYSCCLNLSNTNDKYIMINVFIWCPFSKWLFYSAFKYINSLTKSRFVSWIQCKLNSSAHVLKLRTDFCASCEPQRKVSAQPGWRQWWNWKRGRRVTGI